MYFLSLLLVLRTHSFITKINSIIKTRGKYSKVISLGYIIINFTYYRFQLLL